MIQLTLRPVSHSITHIKYDVYVKLGVYLAPFPTIRFGQWETTLDAVKTITIDDNVNPIQWRLYLYLFTLFSLCYLICSLDFNFFLFCLHAWIGYCHNKDYTEQITVWRNVWIAYGNFVAIFFNHTMCMKSFSLDIYIKYTHFISEFLLSFGWKK